MCQPRTKKLPTMDAEILENEIAQMELDRWETMFNDWVGYYPPSIQMREGVDDTINSLIRS